MLHRRGLRLRIRIVRFGIGWVRIHEQDYRKRNEDS